MTFLHLHADAETYCELELKKVGMDVYCRHPSFEVLMFSWYLQGYTQGVRLDDLYPRRTLPDDFKTLLLHPDVLIHAFNAAFERYVLGYGFGLWLPPEKFRCTMFHAWHLGFSGGLEDIGEQIPIPQDKQKLKEGKALMHKFSKPAPRNHKVDRYTPENAPEAYERYKVYCIQDTEAEMEVDLFCQRYPLPESEQRVWELDQRINDRGLPVDRQLVDAALKVYHDEKKHLTQQLKTLTDLENPNSVPQLMGWFEHRGCRLPNLQKDTITDYLKHPIDSLSFPDIPSRAPDDPVIRALRLRQQAARTAGAKWEAYLRATDWESGRHRHAFSAYGAQRTGRWSGRNLQPHNLHTSPEDQELKVRALLTGSRELVAALFDNPMDVVASCIRAGITAPPGKKLVVSDYHSIENVVLGYLSGCEYINRINREGLDPYRDFATYVFGILYDEVTKAQRKFCKPPVLGCGYQLSGPTLVEYAAQYGVELTLKEAFKLVRIWRKLCWEVKQMWEWFVENDARVIRGEISEALGYGVRIWRDENFLFTTLLSGRNLAYYRPALQPNTIKTVDEDGNPRTFETMSMTYMGRDNKHQWRRISTHGGKRTENVVQALSSDILRYGLLRAEECEEYEFYLDGHVHDEIIGEADEHQTAKAAAMLNKVMSEPLPWAPGLQIRAEGYIAERYRKE